MTITTPTKTITLKQAKQDEDRIAVTSPEPDITTFLENIEIRPRPVGDETTISRREASNVACYLVDQINYTA